MNAALTQEVKLNHVSLSFDLEGTQESSLGLSEMEAQISNKRRITKASSAFLEKMLSFRLSPGLM